MRRPTYLRVVVTTRCNHQCSYCHMEGDPHRGGARELDRPRLVSAIRVACALGAQKIKFLGGEPLLRADLERIVEEVRAFAPSADLSIITAGLADPRRVQTLLAAGLDRINVTFHGFSPSALAERGPNAAAWERRARFVDAVLSAKRPMKVNYVYRAPHDLEDLSALLAWASHTHAVVGLLDELQGELGYDGVAQALRTLRGAPRSIERTDDPHSLETELWRFDDGLRVELKHQRLGEVAPYRACAQCPARARCKEGIFALRLTHRGEIVPCLDRPELAFALTELLDALGPGGERTVATWLAHAIDSGFTAPSPATSAIATPWTPSSIEVQR